MKRWPLDEVDEMFELGVDMMRHRIARENPDLPPAEVEARLREWLLSRPGAEVGDYPGRPGRWPRR